MTREPIPKRRYLESFEIKHLGITYAMQVGCYDDGRLAEVWLGMEKVAGTPMDVIARDTAVLLSLAIQHGVPLEKLGEKVTKDEHGKSEGLAGVVIDVLLAWKPKRDGWGTVPVSIDVQEAEVVEIAAQTAAGRPPITKHNARLFNYTGDQCTSCQNFTMQRNGTCLKCDTCGTTTGCS